MFFLLLALSEEQRQNISEYVALYGKDLYNFAYRLTLNRAGAEDLFQQTWLKVVNNLDKYKDDNFKAWLFKICSNQFKDNYRKDKRYHQLVKDDYADSQTKDFVLSAAQSDDNTEAKIENKDRKQNILGHIYNLPQKQQQVILMFYYQAMKYDDIAAALSVPVGTVRSRINTAKKTLKIQMEGESYV